jgi:Ca-activated chloride channel family protein
METVKREGIDIVFYGCIQKYACRRCCSEPLRKVKQIVSQIINQLGNDRIGIVAYAGSAFPVLPITTDYVAKCFCKA